jgi:hypothetical protein
VPPDLQDLADQLTLTSDAAIGIPLALVAAVLLALGTQLQNKGVALVEESHGEASGGLSFRQVRALLARPSWLLGIILLGMAVVLQLTSLAYAPIIVVQPLGAVALVVTSILNSRLSKVPLDAGSVRAIVICILGVAAFVTLAALFAQEHPITATQLWTVLIILVVVLGTFIALFFWLRKRIVPPIFYVIAGGVLFGFVVTLAKVVIGRVKTIVVTDFEIDAADVLTILCVVGILAAGYLGMYFVQTAHASNPPDLVVAGLTVIDPLVAVTIGIVVLGEAAGAPLWAIVLMGLSAATAIWGVLSLARHHPQLKLDAAQPTSGGSEQR